MKIEDYQTAKAALEHGASLAPEDSRFTELLDECKKHVEGGFIFSSCQRMLSISYFLSWDALSTGFTRLN